MSVRNKLSIVCYSLACRVIFLWAIAENDNFKCVLPIGFVNCVDKKTQKLVLCTKSMRGWKVGTKTRDSKQQQT